MKYLVLLSVLLTIGCKDKDDAPKQATASAPKPKDADDDGPGITVKREAQARAGIRVEELAVHPLQPELTAYGKLEEDPSAVFVVRAPFAGAVMQSGTQRWPAIGEKVADGATFGRIEPRLTLTDRIGLKTQLATAHADLNAGVVAVAAAQTIYDRARALNADNKNISDRALQEGAAKLAAEKAHEDGARATIQVLESSLAAGGAGDSHPIVASRGGDVVEVLAQPGESVEQGAPLVRLARFDHLLARIDLPVGEHIPPNTAGARIVPAGYESEHPLQATRVATTASSDPKAQGISVLYRLNGTLPGLRPGTAVAAYIALPGSSGTGISIPRSAVVQQDGRSWVYIQTKEDRFTRRPITSDMSPRGFRAGDRIVVAGAQSLLSEEFKSQNEADN